MNRKFLKKIGSQRKYPCDFRLKKNFLNKNIDCKGKVDKFNYSKIKELLFIKRHLVEKRLVTNERRYIYSTYNKIGIQTT